jgi:hypothetical protein
MPAAMAQQQQTQIAEGQCGSEADELANCAAQFGDIDVGACLSCVSGALVKGAALANATTCAAYNATFCSSIQSECQASCDDYRCGAEFSLYYLCEAAAAYRNVTSDSTEQQGLCDIDCGSIGNSSGTGGTGSNNGTATTNDDTGSSGGGNEPGSCNSTWNDLRMCLIDQGRDDPAQQECDSCIQDAIPISSSTTSVDCSSLNDQYCNAVTSCDSVCAQAACASEFDVQLRCAAELAATAATGSTCQITKCGSDATSAASSLVLHAPGWEALNRNRAFATLAVVVVAAVAL